MLRADETSLWKTGRQNRGQETGKVFFYYSRSSSVHVCLSGHGQDTPVALEASIVAQPRHYTWVSIGPRGYQQRYCGAQQGCGRNLGARRHFKTGRQTKTRILTSDSCTFGMNQRLKMVVGGYNKHWTFTQWPVVHAYVCGSALMNICIEDSRVGEGRDASYR